jgi:hypothetical protein
LIAAVKKFYGEKDNQSMKKQLTTFYDEKFLGSDGATTITIMTSSITTIFIMTLNTECCFTLGRLN